MIKNFTLFHIHSHSNPSFVPSWHIIHAPSLSRKKNVFSYLICISIILSWNSKDFSCIFFSKGGLQLSDDKSPSHDFEYFNSHSTFHISLKCLVTFNLIKFKIIKLPQIKQSENSMNRSFLWHCRFDNSGGSSPPKVVHELSKSQKKSFQKYFSFRKVIVLLENYVFYQRITF